VLNQLIEAVNDAAGKVGDMLVDVVPIRARQPGGFYRRIMNLDVVALSDEGFGDQYDRALPQVIGSSLEGQAVEADPRMSMLQHRRDDPFEMRFIAGQSVMQKRQIQSGTASDLQEHAQIFRQTRTAEGKSGTQVCRGYVQLAVLNELSHQSLAVNGKRGAESAYLVGEGDFERMNEQELRAFIAANLAGQPNPLQSQQEALQQAPTHQGSDTKQ